MSAVLAIIAPIRAEAPYLIEWIAYHRVLGIQKFILGDNGGDDGTTALLEALDRHGFVTRLDWIDRRYFQLPFYRQAMELGRSDADGFFVIDADEFLRPAEDSRSILELTGSWLANPEIGAVAINWAIYGSSGKQIHDDGLVIERFTRRAPQDYSINKHAKAFVNARCCLGPGSNPHCVTLSSGRYVNTRGEEVAWDQTNAPIGITQQVVWDHLRIDHFVVKSRAEFERKRLRGSAISPITEQQRSAASYFAAHDRNDVEDPAPPLLVERTRGEIQRILQTLGPGLPSQAIRRYD